MTKNPFDHFEFKDRLLLQGDPSIERYSHDTIFQGSPEAVLRARDLQDVSAAMAYAYARSIPMTFCGSQTSMTGASVPLDGLLISTEKMDRVLDIGVLQGRAYATVEPGVIIADLKKTAASQGWFYPPAPTSQDEARLGASISTNATGEDTLLYGTTRRYVREIKVVLADGQKQVFSRGKDEIVFPQLDRAGYLIESTNPLDYFIGGEGTLGFIYEVTVDLIPLPPGYFTALIGFDSPEKTWAFVNEVMQTSLLSPRALELIDKKALDYMATYEGFPQGLKQAATLIYFKQEYQHEADYERLLTAWLEKIEKFSTPQLVQETVVATTTSKQDEMRRWRHQIPLKVNEEFQSYWKVGGGKVGSDWWVPLRHIPAMMEFVYKSAHEAQIPILVFGHMGNGHPHVNYLCQTPEQKIKAHHLLIESCRKAAAYGGGVAGEHGIGKIHHDYLPIQWNNSEIQKMKTLKKEFDPRWLLGRGNILSCPL